MKPLKNENFEELKSKVYDLLNTTIEKRFGNMSFNQIEDAFRLGVRFGKEEPFLNIRTFYRWAYAHKIVIDNAWYEVHTLGKSKQETLYYQEPLKLLK